MANPVCGNLEAGTNSFSTRELYVSAPTVQPFQSPGLRFFVNDNRLFLGGKGGGYNIFRVMYWYLLASNFAEKVWYPSAIKVIES